jgi:hypothetical protein
VKGSQSNACPDVHAEGPVARNLEQQTAKLPSDLFLWAAVGSIITSFLLKVINKHPGFHYLTDRSASANFAHQRQFFDELGVRVQLIKTGEDGTMEETRRSLLQLFELCAMPTSSWLV